MHVGKEAGSQCFGFIRTRHLESWKGPTGQPAQYPTLPWAGLLTAGVWTTLEQPRLLWLSLHLVQTHHHPVLCKELKNNNYKFKKAGLVSNLGD